MGVLFSFASLCFGVFVFFFFYFSMFSDFLHYTTITLLKRLYKCLKTAWTKVKNIIFQFPQVSHRSNKTECPGSLPVGLQLLNGS